MQKEGGFFLNRIKAIKYAAKGFWILITSEHSIIAQTMHWHYHDNHWVFNASFCYRMDVPNYGNRTHFGSRIIKYRH